MAWPFLQALFFKVVRIVEIGWVLALVAGGLTGCQLLPATPEPIAPTPETEETATPEPTETLPPGITPLVFWEPFALDRSQGLLLGEMIRDFEAQSPEVLVEIVPKNGYQGVHEAMLAELSKPIEDRSLPSLAVAFPGMIAQYAEAGIVAPLDAYMNDPEFGLSEEDLLDIHPGYLEAGHFPGFGRQILAFPFVQNAIGMWVNESLLVQAGWNHVPATWPEFEQACMDIAATTGVRCYPFIESVSTFDAWLYSRGGQPLDDTGRRVMFNGPAGAESLALLQRLMAAGLAWRPEGPFGDYVAFANGQAAFAFSSTGSSQFYVDAYDGALNSGMAPFRWYQTLIPQRDPQQPATALYGASFFVVQADPSTEGAAWRLIRWFTERDQTARWTGDLQAMPVRASALEVMTDTLTAYPFFQAQVEEILPHARPEPAVPAEFEVRTILYSAIISATQSLADPQVVLDQAAGEANEILAEQP
jgi:ABC-type glycerol-3-phosphate transport system substrate-binding protein